MPFCCPGWGSLADGTGVLNVISEHFIEAANSTSINAPYGVSEWEISGLHPAPSRLVRPPRVKESVFATECHLQEVKEFESRNPATPGKKTGVLAILEGVNFWAREDAVNEERNLMDPAVGQGLYAPRPYTADWKDRFCARWAGWEASRTGEMPLGLRR